ncbi:hypothetical protein Bbelb_324690 [Branchiostoma belcheri]|nr:hypothetical protein Bbelb_324690 [Branchiostoma belcheri]
MADCGVLRFDQVTRTWLSQTNTLLCGECSELLHRNMSGVIMSADLATTQWAAVTSGSALNSRTASLWDDSDFDGLPVGLYKSASGTNPPLNPPLSLRNSASMIQKHAGGFGQIVIEYKRSSAKVSLSRLGAGFRAGAVRSADVLVLAEHVSRMYRACAKPAIYETGDDTGYLTRVTLCCSHVFQTSRPGSCSRLVDSVTKADGRDSGEGARRSIGESTAGLRRCALLSQFRPDGTWCRVGSLERGVDPQWGVAVSMEAGGSTRETATGSEVLPVSRTRIAQRRAMKNYRAPATTDDSQPMHHARWDTALYTQESGRDERIFGVCGSRFGRAVRRIVFTSCVRNLPDFPLVFSPAGTTFIAIEVLRATSLPVDNWFGDNSTAQLQVLSGGGDSDLPNTKEYGSLPADETATKEDEDTHETVSK